ncbi:MAG TPA: metallophosphoesterase [Candidatus Methylomirabilis sp.]
MRFLHTADWQIGMKASHVGEAGTRVRDERVAAARRVVEAARDAGADFILVAGDTFEDNGVDRVLIQKAADILAGFGGPVCVIPGNHDPLVPGAVWDHPAWKASANVHVLREERPVEIPGGTLYPCPVRAKRSGMDPTAWIPREEGRGLRIGLAHGTVEGVHQEEPDYPIPRDAASRSGLDYLALGHWHSAATYPGPDGVVRMAYSGTHETTKFGERDSGNALLVEIAGPGVPPMITPVRTAGLSWLSIEEDVRNQGDIARIRERIEGIADAASTLLDVRLAGVLPTADQQELGHVQEILTSRFAWARLDSSGLRPSPGDDAWVANLPAGVLRDAAAKLRALADPAFGGSRPEGASPDVASRALLEFYAILGGEPR